MEKEFLKIIDENKQRITRLCMFYEKNPETRKDLYQEIAYQVWKSLKTFKNESSINTWLYRIAVNTAITFKRKNKNEGLNKTLDNYYKIKSSYDLEKDIEENEMLEMLYKKIESLNKIEQTIVLLFLEGFSHKEISQITGFTENNTGVKMNRIKNKLKELIEGE